MVRITDNVVKVNVNGNMVPIGMIGGGKGVGGASSDIVVVNEDPTENTKLSVKTNIDEQFSILEKSDIKNDLTTTDLNKVLDARQGKVISDIMSYEWSSSKQYSIGDYCIYNGRLWRCIDNNSGHTPIEGTRWVQVNIANEIQKASVKIKTIDSITTSASAAIPLGISSESTIVGVFSNGRLLIPFLLNSLYYAIVLDGNITMLKEKTIGPVTIHYI